MDAFLFSAEGVGYEAAAHIDDINVVATSCPRGQLFIIYTSHGQ